MTSVDILLATFNGAAHLPAQLESIAAQSVEDWRLIARDDGSSDATPDILNGFAEQFPDRVSIIGNSGEKLGACGNFAALLNASEAPCFLFCDQDDVWLPNKVEKMIAALHDAETRAGNATPVMVQSDLTVVDEALAPLHKSFWAMHRVADVSPQLLMIQNQTPGCAIMGNAALRSLARPIPAGAHIHDWWVALVAAQFGEVVSIPEQLTLYRQHQKNEIGAQRWSASGLAGRLFREGGGAVSRGRRLIANTQAQARLFVETYGDRLDPETKALFSEYAALAERSFFVRKSFFFRRNLWPDYWLRGAAMWWFT